MDSIEKDARARHGDMMYGLIWKARADTDLRLWGAVLLLNYFLFFMLSLIFCLVMGFVDVYYYTPREIPHSVFGFSLLIGLLLTITFNVAVRTSQAMGFASNMYGVAAEMWRRPRSLVTCVMLVIAGGSSVVVALAVWKLRKHSLQKFAMTELDYLGSIFPERKCWTNHG